MGKGCATTTGDPALDQVSSDERARAEVAKQIRVKVVQLVEDIQQEEGRGGESLHAYSVKVETREMVDRTLQGVRIVERTVDPARGVICSVAVLDKANMAARIRAELEKTLAETGGYLAAADRAGQTGNPTEALRAYTLGMASLGPATVQAGLMRDLGYTAPPMPAHADVWQRWMNTLQAIRVRVLEGDGQKARPGKPLAAPLRLRAEMNGAVPAAGLPLRVLRAPEGLDMQQHVQTDRSGEAMLWVTRVPSGRTAIQEIAVGLDWERLLQERTDSVPAPDSDGWDAREVVITYRVPVPSDYRVGVAVYDGDTGRAMMGSPLQTALLEALQRSGFQTHDIFGMPGELPRAFSGKPSLVDARRRLEGLVDILVLGDVHVGTPRTSEGFVFCDSRMTVQGVALSSGGTLFSLDLKARAGHRNNELAINRSLEEIGKSLRAQAGEKLADALP